MNKKMIALPVLALLAGAPAFVRAADTNHLGGATGAPAKPYPLDYCIVSTNKFDGDMDEPVTNNYHGQQIIFCCSDCVKDFKKDPDKYLKQLKEAAAKAQK